MSTMMSNFSPNVIGNSPWCRGLLKSVLWVCLWFDPHFNFYDHDMMGYHEPPAWHPYVLEHPIQICSSENENGSDSTLLPWLLSFTQGYIVTVLSCTLSLLPNPSPFDGWFFFNRNRQCLLLQIVLHRFNSASPLFSLFLSFPWVY